jgi:putative ABC transport system substrate-binding protein
MRDTFTNARRVEVTPAGDAQRNCSIKHVTLVFNPDTTPFYPAFLRELAGTPESLGVELSASPAHDEAEIEPTIAAFAREPAGGLIAAPDAFIGSPQWTASPVRHGRRADLLWTGYRRNSSALGFVC